jgi:hypothetical protein
MVNQTLTDLKTNDTRIKLQHTRTQGTAVSEAMQRNNSSQPTETVTSDTILDLHCEKDAGVKSVKKASHVTSNLINGLL